MKLLILLGLIVLSGCLSSTRSSYRVYDEEGRLVVSGESTESVVSSITKSLEDKTVVVYESGWSAYVSCSPGTSDDPTPHVKLYAGKRDRGYVSTPHEKAAVTIPDIIRASRSDLKVGFSGVSSTGDR